jgi:hypothetical protein
MSTSDSKQQQQQQDGVPLISQFVISYSGSYFTEARLRDLGVSIHVLCLFALALLEGSHKALDLHIFIWFCWNILYVWVMISPRLGVVWANHSTGPLAFASPFREYHMMPIGHKEALLDLIIKIGLTTLMMITSLMFSIFSMIKLLGDGNCTGECAINTEAYWFSVVFAIGIFISCLWILYRMVLYWEVSTIPERAVPARMQGEVRM